MNELYADRMAKVHKSFIREILKVTEDPSVISFAGGLPNPKFFAVEEMADATTKVLTEDGRNALQYSTTEGYLPLREYISERYFTKKGLRVEPDEILITNGSQQGLDLIGKVFLNKGDRIVVERPGYLGALQAFTIFEPQFEPVPLLEDGIDTDLLEERLKANRLKLVHGVVNFQNPSGATYSKKKRMELSDILKGHNTIFIEDDPYGELRFAGEDLPSIKTYLGEDVILLGSFSKIVAPGLRLGWICSRKDIMERMVVAKQASDLHSNYLSQRVVYRYLTDHSVDAHILRIRAAYKRQRDLMISSIENSFPQEVGFTRPEGGMFLWVTLPENLSAMRLFDLAREGGVAFVPGKAFYVDGGGNNTFRLNFSNSDEEEIEEGINRLGRVIEMLMEESG